MTHWIKSKAQKETGSTIFLQHCWMCHHDYVGYGLLHECWKQRDFSLCLERRYICRKISEWENYSTPLVELKGIHRACKIDLIQQYLDQTNRYARSVNVSVYNLGPLFLVHTARRILDKLI